MCSIGDDIDIRVTLSIQLIIDMSLREAAPCDNISIGGCELGCVESSQPYIALYRGRKELRRKCYIQH